MEGYVDFTTDEKLLSHWEENCLLRPDQSKTVGLVGKPGMACPKCELRDLPQTFGAKLPDGRAVWISKELAEKVIEQNKKRPYTISDKLADYLIYQNEWEEDHVAHVAGVRTPASSRADASEVCFRSRKHSTVLSDPKKVQQTKIARRG
jgi:hypothetical protein